MTFIQKYTKWQEIKTSTQKRKFLFRGKWHLQNWKLQHSVLSLIIYRFSIKEKCNNFKGKENNDIFFLKKLFFVRRWNCYIELSCSKDTRVHLRWIHSQRFHIIKTIISPFWSCKTLSCEINKLNNFFSIM